MNLTGSNSQTISQTKAVVLIPARFASTRLPGKALLEIDGKPMICWVAERAMEARNVARVIVATDDERICDVVRSSGVEAVMTRADHASGTDRLAEVAETLEDADIIVNLQGDEPLISAQTIERVIEASDDESVGIVTTWEAIETAADVLNPDVVKIVVDNSGRALYFSRSPVPYPREAVRKHVTLETALRNEPGLLGEFRKHTGLYVYRKEVLLEFTRWPQSNLERVECLEQLRALERGVKIKAIEASTPSIGVDTREDLERVRASIQKEHLEFAVERFKSRLHD
ncbi:MAG: 3-deoxy-manno-octulosonate cytidylyltransferase [Pyrinomonadaceae bacterium]|nr:3-deoxy-manno-octulosonate cytidylyltransferase [Pyrinomonadaceae bacterium]